MRSILVAGTALLILSASMAAEPPEAARAHLFPRSTYSWPFNSGPSYGEIATSRWSEPGILHTRVGSFDLKRGSPALPAELRAAPDSRYAILQVDPAGYADGRFDRIRGLLESQGGALLEAMAVSAHVVRATPQLQGLLRAQDGVLALEPYHPAFKLAPTIGRAPLPDPARATSDIYRLEAVLFRGEDAQQAAAALAGVGATILKTDPDVVTFELSRERLADAARLQAVQAIFESLPNMMHGEEASAYLQTQDRFGGLPYTDAGIRGDGNGLPGTSAEVLMVLDSGLQLDAGDLSDTRTSAGTAGPGHRKVLLYTPAVGGAGDALGCDAGPQGGFTHGHAMAATAVGNAGDVPAGYGVPWPLYRDPYSQNTWRLDGVAPRAKLLMYDAQVTPSTLSCGDPAQNTLTVGTLYTDDTPGSGSLGDAYARGARVSNFSWGTGYNSVYGTNAQRIDQFLFDQPDAMVFVAAGDNPYDCGCFDSLISEPATCKSCTVVGAVIFSREGPVATAHRMAPLVATYEEPVHPICRSNDNDQDSPVECDILGNDDTSSYAAATVSGAALLVRDWFQQGFYPDGTATNADNAADQVPSISGALLKAVLITSAGLSKNYDYPYRFNPRWGYGRLGLENALPLSSYAPSPTGMIVADGGLASGGRLDIAGLPGSIAAAGTTQTGTIRIGADRSELRCALVWTEDAGDALAHDLDLEMVSPSGKVYFGNFFTEDLNRNGLLDAGENCRGAANSLDQGDWSIETNSCEAGPSRRDTWNPNEGIFLSPDPQGDGIDQGTDSQIEVGDWSLKVIYRTGTGSQRYAVSCSGPISGGSSVRFDRPAYACANEVGITVQEANDPSDPTPLAAEVASRTTVQVLDASGVVRDSETQLAFTAVGLRFASVPLLTTTATAYDPGNGVLDVQPGDRLRVIYADETGGAPDPAKTRITAAEVDCRPPPLGVQAIARFGRDGNDLIQGGCERDARGLFTFGFPDQHMDAGETLAYQVNFFTQYPTVLHDVEVSLRCVKADADSPADCPPASTACADPDRLNNPPCTEMTILDSPHLLHDGSGAPTFTVRMASAISGTPKVDMLVGVTAKLAGQTQARLLAFRKVLDADDVDSFYSTDYPTGGTEYRDENGNETLENPTTDVLDPDNDYLFETRTYGDLTAGGTRNTSIHAPWNFDANDGGFRVGLNPTAGDVSTQTIANWGEDKNFNAVLDPGEDRDPVNGILDRGWNTKGGCGWQTKGSNAKGGIWHTGTIGETNALGCENQCELVDVVTGTSALSQWEMLLTPVVQKVNPGVDADGDLTHRVAFTNWAWNAAVDVRSSLTEFTGELDTDTESLQSINLFDKDPFFSINRLTPIAGLGISPPANSVPVFAPMSGSASVNGTAGNSRVGSNPCLFELSPRNPDSTFRHAGPTDDDLDEDGDLLLDEYVAANGPIRNMDRKIASYSVDLRYQTLEDAYGDAGNSFQGALGFRVTSGAVSEFTAGYGIGVDDMVLEWKETSQVKDGTDCAGGACATVSLDATNAYEGSGVMAVTVIDASPWEPAHSVNDCNGDGDYLDAADDQDCDDDSTPDVTVRVTSPGEPAGEVFVVDRVSPGGAVWKGDVPFSSTANVPGVIYWPGPYLDGFDVKVRYEDRDDGTGQRCPTSVDPSLRGFVETGTYVARAPAAPISVVRVRLQDNGDHDGLADPNETVTMYVTLHNNGSVDRSGLVVRLSSNDPNVDCIVGPAVAFGSLAGHETREATTALTFRVANVTRTSVDDDLTAKLHVNVRGDDFDVPGRDQEVALDLDLNISGGLLPTTYTEGFEGTGFGTFTSMSLDTGKATLALSDGHRCQYSDPDFPNSSSYGNTMCYLGFVTSSQNAYDWHVHGLAAPDGGRAYLGNNSLHWGVHSGAASADTTRLKQLDAIRLINTVNLGWNGVTPELSFKHQVGLSDCDYVSCPGYFTVDRGVVQLQLANSAGQAVGSWRTIAPYENLYDSQNVDNYTNCMFDPTDDGNTEDDYFDPTDPSRRLGPSSTCYPEFVFSRQGAIFYTAGFDPADIHHASDGPGLQGSRGPGTWVQTKFDLSRYRGRRLRLRFLATSIEVGDAVTMQQALQWNPIEADDGWYIDDVKVTNALTSAATVTVDTADRTALPGCGPSCSAVSAAVAASPAATAAPGQVALISAAGSFVDGCPDGILLFRFWEDRNGNGVVGDAGDVLLRSWSEDPILEEAPILTTRYGMEVRCSSLPSCQASATALVTVPCPSTGNARVPFDQAIGFASKTQLAWPAAEPVDVIRGDLGLLRSLGGQFNGTVEACLGNDVSVSSLVDATLPASGAGKYYLVRGAGPSPYCNATPSWKTGVAAEKPGAGGDRDADIALDPQACP